MKAFSLGLGASVLAHGAMATVLMVGWPSPVPDVAPQAITADLVFAPPALDTEKTAIRGDAVEPLSDDVVPPAEVASTLGEQAPAYASARPTVPVSNPGDIGAVPQSARSATPPEATKVTEDKAPRIARLIPDAAEAHDDTRTAEPTDSAARDAIAAPDGLKWTRSLPSRKPAPPRTTATSLGRATPPSRPLAAPAPPRERPAEAPPTTEKVDPGADRPMAASSDEPVATRLAARGPSTDQAAPVATPPLLAAPGLANPQPRYPAVARRRGYEGRVVIWVRVDAEGAVEVVEIAETSGHRILDRAALRAVRQWRFIPAQRDGRAVAAEVSVPVRFSLRSEAAALGR